MIGFDKPYCTNAPAPEPEEPHYLLSFYSERPEGADVAAWNQTLTDMGSVGVNFTRAEYDAETNTVKLFGNLNDIYWFEVFFTDLWKIEIPESDLEVLRIIATEIESLELEHLHSLRRVHLYSNQLYAVPKVANMVYYLEVQGNPISGNYVIPSHIQHFTGSNCAFETVVSTPGSVLSTCSISSNDLVLVDLRYSPDLIHLSVALNEYLSDLSWLGACSGIRELRIDYTNISALPVSVASHSQLVRFSATGSTLQDFDFVDLITQWDGQARFFDLSDTEIPMQQLILAILAVYNFWQETGGNTINLNIGGGNGPVTNPGAVAKYQEMIADGISIIADVDASAPQQLIFKFNQSHADKGNDAQAWTDFFLYFASAGVSFTGADYNDVTKTVILSGNLTDITELCLFQVGLISANVEAAYNVDYMTLAENPISELAILGVNLRTLEIPYCNFRTMPPLPTSLEQIYAQNNPFEGGFVIPSHLKYCNVSSSNVTLSIAPGSALETLIADGCPNITEIDIQYAYYLNKISLVETPVTGLDVSQNYALRNIDLTSTKATHINGLGAVLSAGDGQRIVNAFEAALSQEFLDSFIGDFYYFIQWGDVSQISISMYGDGNAVLTDPYLLDCYNEMRTAGMDITVNT